MYFNHNVSVLPMELFSNSIFWERVHASKNIDVSELNLLLESIPSKSYYCDGNKYTCIDMKQFLEKIYAQKPSWYFDIKNAIDAAGNQQGKKILHNIDACINPQTLVSGCLTMLYNVASNLFSKPSEDKSKTYDFKIQ